MRWKASFEFLSVLGAVVGFSAWAFQQTQLSAANDAIQSIRSAQTAFEAYQSNNGVFNALAVGADPARVSEIRRFQIISYEQGLSHLEALLDPADSADIPPAPRALDGDWDANAALQTENLRIGGIQSALTRKKATISQQAEASSRIFLALYAVGSILVLAANAGKLLCAE